MTVSVVTGTGVGGDAQGGKVALGSVEAILGSALDDVLTGDSFDNIL